LKQLVLLPTQVDSAVNWQPPFLLNLASVTEVVVSVMVVLATVVAVISQVDCPIGPHVDPLSDVVLEQVDLPRHSCLLALHTNPTEQPANLTAS
jgi:hypothetical protein